MSRSIQRHKIAWGRATQGGKTRSKTSYSDDLVKKNRKKYGKILIKKRHWRAGKQTVEDYIIWLKSLFNSDISIPGWMSTALNERTKAGFIEFLDGREPTEELFREYAEKLWKRDRSK